MTLDRIDYATGEALPSLTHLATGPCVATLPAA